MESFHTMGASHSSDQYRSARNCPEGGGAWKTQPMTRLRDLAAVALRDGWVTAEGVIEDAIEDAKAAGWVPVPIRRGEPAVTTLRPLSAEQAHPRSLSAIAGLGQQPFHTDGAHLRQMPDIVVLATEAASPTPTLLVDPGPATASQRQGVFRVSTGRDAFYASAVDADGRWRYDPGCMTPADQRAATAVEEIGRMSARAVRHEWRSSSTVLVLANRRILHARATAVDAATRRVHRVAFATGLDS